MSQMFAHIESNILEFTISNTIFQPPHINHSSIPEQHQTLDDYHRTLSHEMRHQEHHLVWRVEVAQALGDEDQVEDDVNMVFLTRFINHQLLPQPNTIHIGGPGVSSGILTGMDQKRS